MEKVVYVLGAGFSRGLGLPLMTDFVSRAKDLYFAKPEEHEDFVPVFRLLNDVAKARLYFNFDLVNIEEVLSILEMQAISRRRGMRSSFIKFLLRVIEGYTPTFRPGAANLGFDSLDEEEVFGAKAPEASPAPRLEAYTRFVAALAGLSYWKGRNRKIHYLIRPQEVEYSIISLNYDMVLENALAAAVSNFVPEAPTGPVAFKKPDQCEASGPELIKLHGSVDTGDVIAPTWNKTLTPKVLPTWKAALRLLSRANHIRIIGYSLPPADAYIRYLFKAAIIESAGLQQTPHLKTLDVMCLDDDISTVKLRYESFAEKSVLRFFDVHTEDYLHFVPTRRDSLATDPGPINEASTGRRIMMGGSQLEIAHARFVSDYAASRASYGNHVSKYYYRSPLPSPFR